MEVCVAEWQGIGQDQPNNIELWKKQASKCQVRLATGICSA